MLHIKIGHVTSENKRSTKLPLGQRAYNGRMWEDSLIRNMLVLPVQLHASYELNKMNVLQQPMI